MKNRDFVYDGWKANGFVALACELVLLAGFIALIVWGALRADALQPGGAWMIAGGAAGLLAVVIGLCGFMLLEPMQNRRQQIRYLHLFAPDQIYSDTEQQH